MDESGELNPKSADASNPFVSVPVEVIVSVGKARPLIRDLVNLGENAILTLDKKVEDPVDLYVGDRLVARGQLEEMEGDQVEPAGRTFDRNCRSAKRAGMTRKFIALGALAVFVLLAQPQAALAQELSLNLADGQSISARTIQLILLITVLSVAPGLLVMLTCFPFLITVLSILRQGIGLQQAPPNMLMISLAMFLTYFVMEPVFTEAWETGIAPLIDEELEVVLRRWNVLFNPFGSSWPTGSMLTPITPSPISDRLRRARTPRPTRHSRYLSQASCSRKSPEPSKSASWCFCRSWLSIW